MNGSRSQELTASDALLESNNTDISIEPLQPSSIEYTTKEFGTSAPAQNHLSSPLMLPGSEMQQAHQKDQQALHQQPLHQQPLHQQTLHQQAELNNDAVHHLPAASWQQSEASMQEAATTSGSSESGTVCKTCPRNISTISANHVSFILWLELRLQHWLQLA